MKYALILAGGTGQRMGNVELPKQFLSINNKEIILHTLEKFYLFKEELEHVIVVVHPNWVAYAQDLIKGNFKVNPEFFKVIEGGETRNDTVQKGMQYIIDHYEVNENSIVLTHDAVRPFISYKIIRDNIDYTLKHGAVDTVINSIDTIVVSDDGIGISNIPERAKYYQGQTPQSFKVLELTEVYRNLNQEQLNKATDVATLYKLLNKRVFLVKGDQLNFKITTPFDLKIAKALLEQES